MITDDFYRWMPSKRAVRVGDVWEARAELGENLLNVAEHGHVEGVRFID